MNKPLTVARQEFAENIVKTINESGLPAFVMYDILKSCEKELNALSERQYADDKKAYEQSLEATNNEDD